LLYSLNLVAAFGKHHHGSAKNGTFFIMIADMNSNLYLKPDSPYPDTGQHFYKGSAIKKNEGG
jgi:hypothetical protein